MPLRFLCLPDTQEASLIRFYTLLTLTPSPVQFLHPRSIVYSTLCTADSHSAPFQSLRLLGSQGTSLAHFYTLRTRIWHSFIPYVPCSIWSIAYSFLHTIANCRFAFRALVDPFSHHFPAHFYCPIPVLCLS
jgi:hypothetical protein